jgi:hypothetical protein
VPDDRGLDRYREMRDFEATPEPRGDGPRPDPAHRRFVIQQHDATRLHWDLRLEDAGVLASWAMPRGLPWSPKEMVLATSSLMSAAPMGTPPPSALPRDIRCGVSPIALE